MPNRRDPSQTTFTISVGKKMLGIVDEIRVTKLRGMARAQFIRDAIAEKLATLGIVLPDEDIVAPVRGSRSAEEPEVYEAKKKVAKKSTKKKSA